MDYTSLLKNGVYTPPPDGSNIEEAFEALNKVKYILNNKEEEKTMSDKIEEQEVAEAIPAEVGETCDPYDGEQEAFENGLGNEVTVGIDFAHGDDTLSHLDIVGNCGGDKMCTKIMPDGELREMSLGEVQSVFDNNEVTEVSIGRGTTNPALEVFPTETQLITHEVVNSLAGLDNYAQDQLPVIMQNLITKYVFIKTNYKFILDFNNGSIGSDNKPRVERVMNTEAVVEFADKLLPLLENTISLNDFMTSDKLPVLASFIADQVSTMEEFTTKNYLDLFDVIIDFVIPDANSPVINYKEQYKDQMKSLVIPNMVEDVMITFNSPKGNVDDILGIISTDMPDAEKYKIVKTSDKEYTIVIFGSEDGHAVYIPAVYVLKETETLEGDYNYNVTSRVSSQEEVDSLLTIYCDSTRWKI